MCGRRVEGWAGLLPVATPLQGPVPDELPSAYDRTRPVEPSAALLQSFDEESLRPTREMPSIGHELRALSPDHRVHTSPTGHILPTGVMNALGIALDAADRHPPAATAPGYPAPIVIPGGLPGSGGEGVPVVVRDEPTDHVRLPRRDPLTETLHLSLLALLCACVAVLVGLFAYRLMTRAVDGGAVVLGGGEAATEPAAPRPAARARAALPHGVHRTRDLVVSVNGVSQKRGDRRQLHGGLPPAGLNAGPTLDSRPPEAHAAVAGAAAGVAAGVAAGAPVAGAAVAGAAAGKGDDKAPSAAGQAATSARGAALAAAAPIEEVAPLTAEEQRVEAEAQLAAADIEFVASTHNGQVRSCHERAFKDVAGQSPGGKVELAFTLNEEGRAVNVSTAANTTGSELLARCLEGRVSEWRFPRPVGGAKHYQFPFVFMATTGGR